MYDIKISAIATWHRIDSGIGLFRRINQLSVSQAYLLSTLMLCCISAADYVTGIELMMSPMYAFPCLLMDWRIGRLQALLYAIAASLVQWLVGTYGGRSYSHPSYIYWDVVLNVVFYGALIWVVAKLRLALEMERLLSRVDFLTRLANRASLYDALKLEIQRSRRYGHSLTLVSIDCDNFAGFNERKGHSTGDLLLQAVADALSHQFRSTDLITRYGGDEFMIVLPETGAQHMDILLAKLRQHLDNLMLLRSWPMSFNLACSIFTYPPEDLSRLMEMHGESVRQGKQQGYNQLVQRVWQDDPELFQASAWDSHNRSTR